MAEQICPTKGNLINCKKSLVLAKLGFELLDRKRNVMMREMMRLIDVAGDLQKDIGNVFSGAYTTLQNANVSMGIQNIMVENAPAENGVQITSRSVMGVDLPIVTLEEKPLVPHYGFDETNIEMDKAMAAFANVKRLTARLAGVDNSVYRLAVAIKKTQRRANMLENVVIPRYENSIHFISGVLEEREREEFTRMKVIKRTKQRAK